MNARRLTAEETRRLSDLETAAERAEEARDFRAAAIAWGEGRDLCRAAGLTDSAALWQGHAMRAAGLAFKLAAKEARAAARRAAPPAARLSLFGSPVAFR